jgi:hypothetical protein
MTNLKFIVGGLLAILISAPSTFAQGIDTTSAGGKIVNTVSTAVPFLRIAPDARSGAMGDLGIAISPDPNGWYWNPAKMAFVEDETSFSVTYTPWLQELVDDIYLASLSGYKKLDDIQTIGGSLRYFSLGSIQFTDASGNFLKDYKPNEFAIDFGYSRKLSDVFSAGLMLRYIYSNLAKGMELNGVPIKAGQSVAADIAFYYSNEVELGSTDGNLSLGLNISNIGAKITYTDDASNKDYIPTNMGLGSALMLEIDEHNQVTFGLDVNKLLVPTPVASGEHKNQSVPSAIFGSFSDAPGGASEELNELMYSAGVEYWYDQQFAVRAGYFNEHSTKGNRKFVTVGLGVKYKVFGLNFSYLVPTTNQRNPLDNTLRFSLLFDFGEAESN